MQRVKNKWWPRAMVMAVLMALAGLGYGWYWTQSPLNLDTASGNVLDLSIPQGSSARQVAQGLHDAGVQAPAWWLYGWLRVSGQSRLIKAGSYEIDGTLTPSALLGKLVRGEQAVRRVTLVEGWNIRQVLQTLQNAEFLTYDLPPSTALDALMPALGLTGHPEGRFFPDTYVYPKRDKASNVLRQAAQAMERQLAQVWAARAGDLPLQSPQEALILASLVEKETGAAADRPMIAGVFINRLRKGMRLQTDPSVIYGVGERYDGRLHRSDLDTDTPYNTYTRAGLPPTPIAMPGLAALRASVQPAVTDALYFVAKGDGSSQFSPNLDAHNQAVKRYILKR